MNKLKAYLEYRNAFLTIEGFAEHYSKIEKAMKILEDECWQYDKYNYINTNSEVNLFFLKQEH